MILMLDHKILLLEEKERLERCKRGISRVSLECQHIVRFRDIDMQNCSEVDTLKCAQLS